MANGTIIFQVKAVDADFGNNSIVTYSLLRGEYSGKFAIDASSGNITLIGELDHENTSKIILRIQATDGEFFTNMTLAINVEDVNDSPPEFTECRNVTFEEPVEPRTKLQNVSASDADYGSNANITYSLTVTNVEVCKAKFEIDEDGNIQSLENLPRGSTCNVTIYATDGVHKEVCAFNLQVEKDPNLSEKLTDTG